MFHAGTAFQLMAAFLVNFAALVVHLQCRPWVNNKLDTMQAYSVLVQTITIFYSIMLFIMQNSNDTSQGSSSGKLFAETLVILVNCFVTVFPFLNNLYEGVSMLTETYGIISTIRRIPISFWTIFVWDLCLLVVAVLALIDALPSTPTNGAYFLLFFKSLEVMIGSIFSMYTASIVFKIALRYRTNIERKKKPNSFTEGEFLWFEFFTGVLHVVPLIFFWYYLEDARKKDADIAPKLACLISSCASVLFMCWLFYKLDNMKDHGWKALQTQEQDKAFGSNNENEENAENVQNEGKQTPSEDSKHLTERPFNFHEMMTSCVSSSLEFKGHTSAGKADSNEDKAKNSSNRAKRQMPNVENAAGVFNESESPSPRPDLHLRSIVIEPSASGDFDLSNTPDARFDTNLAKIGTAKLVTQISHEIESDKEAVGPSVTRERQKGQLKVAGDTTPFSVSVIPSARLRYSSADAAAARHEAPADKTVDWCKELGTEHKPPATAAAANVESKAVDSRLTSNAVAPDKRKEGTNSSAARESLAGANDSCNVCGKEASTMPEGKLFACKQCLSAFYCSASCQQKHWGVHRKICKPAVNAPRDWYGRAEIGDM